MTSIHLESINESFVRINADVGVLREIATRFAFRVEGYQFMTRFKAGIWDGYIRPINTKNGLCPKGLVPKVIQYARDNDYEYSLDKGFARFKEKIAFDYKKLLLPFEPHDFQHKAVEIFLSKKRQVILSATGSGKSAIAYMMVHSVLDAIDDKKILIIVPTIGLVTQLVNDFKDYSVNNNWDVDGNVHMIMGGKDKNSHKRILVSTWQSLHNIKQEGYFEQFEVIIGDECFHGDTPILTKTGYKPIKDIHAGEIIINYDETKKVFKEDVVVELFENLNKSISSNMLELEMENGTFIKVTENHKFLTNNRGWVEAKNLTTDDDICSPEIIDELYITGNKNKRYWYKGVLIDTAHNRLIKNIIKNINISDENYKLSHIILNKIIHGESISELLRNRKSLLCSYNGFRGNIIANKMRKDGILKQKYHGWVHKRDGEGNIIPWNKGLTKEGHEGLMKMSLSRMGINNPVYRIKDIDSWHQNVSAGIRLAIQEGRFTPKSNNRLTHADIQYNGKTYRSSWECAWHHLYPNHLYEAVRIPYVDIDGENRITIVDFHDTETKTLIEIKPYKVSMADNSKCKLDAIQEYCVCNNLSFKLITEADIIPLIKTISVFDNFNDKAIRLLKGYQNENKKHKNH